MKKTPHVLTGNTSGRPLPEAIDPFLSRAFRTPSCDGWREGTTAPVRILGPRLQRPIPLTKRNVMKHLLLGLAVCSLSLPTLAQQAPKPCGTDAERLRLIAEDPTYLIREAAFEAELRARMAESAGQRDDDQVYIIPTVFHIVHQRGDENISNEQILDAMEVLNRDFRKLNADTINVHPSFADIVGDARIEFRLPTIDPLGNCTNGIDRVYSPQTFLGESTSKPNPWPRDKYMNVWVTRTIVSGAAGYFTGAPSISDGILILDGYVGRIGTGTENLSRALTHEVGHYFSLNHVWGSNNGEGNPPAGHMQPDCGDDGVEDTPITRGWNICPPVANRADCDPNIIENVENYMEYSYCPSAHMFTEGQVERMRFAAQSPSSQRDNLWTEQNLQVTGIAEGYRMTCGPLADFYAVVGNSLTSPVVPFTPTTCTNTNVRFVDNSSRSFPTGWSWTFQDGNPATSTERNPTVQFTSPGWKTVTLTVSNDNGSSTKTDEYAVLIGGNDLTVQGSYQESFEGDAGIYPYFEANYGVNHTYYRQYVGGGHTGSKCAWLNSGDRFQLNFIDPTNAFDYDDLISPNMDLDAMQSAQLSFWYSYSTTTTTLADATEKLEIYSSTDCGRTWQLRTTVNGEALITNGNMNNGPGVWAQKTVTLPSSVLNNNIRFRFRFISSEFSNDLFIDDINISGSVGIEDMSADQLLNVFPNPSNDQFTIQAFGMDRFRTEMTITDMSGAIVYSNSIAPTGGTGIVISSNALNMANGLYFLRVANEAGTSTQRINVMR